MYGTELKIGFWAAVSPRSGAKGTEPLMENWYRIESLRRDEDDDWIIGIGGNRYEWLLSWQTIPAIDADTRPRSLYLIPRRHPMDIEKGRWVYLPLPDHQWFKTAANPRPQRAKGDGYEVVIPLIGREPAVFRIEAKVSTCAT